MIPNTRKFHYFVTIKRTCPWTREVRTVQIRGALFCRTKAEFKAELAQFNSWGNGLRTYKAA